MTNALILEDASVTVQQSQYFDVNMRMYLTFLLFLYICEFSYSYNNDKCETKDKCSECIQELGCIWCTQPHDRTSHCIDKNVERSHWCLEDKIVRVQSRLSIMKDSPLRHQQDGDDAIQLRPQEVHLTLQKGEEYKLSFQYAQAANYPVDLYYIMDLSASMAENKKHLGKLGNKIASTMRNITNNFRLGFGSFVDKVELPFVSTHPDKLKNPCGSTGQCDPAYSFKHHMSLSDNGEKFSSEVQKAKMSGNLDSPEGGFDALMQAIVCKDEIGWRKQARHLIVLSTDAEFHIAGDGKLAGIVEPSDGKCHMEDGMYSMASRYDYPSISHINYIAKENNINIIFAVDERVFGVYEALKESIENSQAAKLPKKEEDDVVKLIHDNYNKIVDSVVMGHTAENDVEIKFLPDCPQPIENGCSNIRVGEIVNFTATIKPVRCLSGDETRIIRIKPKGIDEVLTIKLTVPCTCECEKSGHTDFENNSQECSSAGNLECGVCDCNPERFGRKCECDKQSSLSDKVEGCKANPNDTSVCSDRGICKCNKCECQRRPASSEKIYGRYCECDNFSCKRVGGELCSGRGVCDCGVCKCDAGFAGDDCHCPDSKRNCFAPKGGGECSGRGECVCGECRCSQDEQGRRYSGKYCEECITCPGQRCEELQSCVVCDVNNFGSLNATQCPSDCGNVTISLVDKIQDEVQEGKKVCRAVDHDCTIIFEYEYDDENNIKLVRAQKAKICSEGPDVWAWVLGVVGSIILGGLLMLVMWKILTTIHDRKEYAKFENERKNSKWHSSENPLYRGATSTHVNPLFRQSGKFSFSKQ